ncbi:recombinase RecT [Mycolicibacterium pulveris]|uniref:Recombinase RecT n=1 Tax=Mycolicibacterium pulveris TaxID=36813 RepID=A0A7I7URZ2_MYCPV|nr:recombinase RecT [Mycolicibacterium pulveris]MCV6982143.1 recombinase RecT [Mycolicibacterium pulveris]BBY78903.1 hypothetical protein MPUL_00610 [Mycolicibacterium pulveris]BBY84212.1 hypothetical protein MPUL_53700 [Mycolicibacterium pulveris]
MTSTDVVRQTPKQKTLAKLIVDMTPELEKALPKHVTPERMARIAVTVVRATPKLAECSPASFLGALLTASQLGLEPGPTGEAYFVPYGNVCTFIPGYRGLIKLARQSGQVSDIYAEIVYSNDKYKVTLGLNRDIEHEIVDRNNRGEPTDVYAVAKFKDGTTTFVTMTKAEVEAIRARSRASKDGPWATDWNAMAKKTAVRQLAKWLPLSPEFNTAVSLDGSTRTDVGPLVDAQTEFVDGEVVGDQQAIEGGESGPGQDGGNDQSEGAEPSSGAEVQSDSGDQADPPADVVYAGRNELKTLAQIRAAEQHDDASWKAFVANSIGREVANDKQLTMAEAEQIIAIFNEDAGQ